MVHLRVCIKILTNPSLVTVLNSGLHSSKQLLRNSQFWCQNHGKESCRRTLKPAAIHFHVPREADI